MAQQQQASMPSPRRSPTLAPPPETEEKTLSPTPPSSQTQEGEPRDVSPNSTPHLTDNSTPPDSLALALTLALRSPDHLSEKSTPPPPDPQNLALVLRSPDDQLLENQTQSAAVTIGTLLSLNDTAVVTKVTKAAPAQPAGRGSKKRVLPPVPVTIRLSEIRRAEIWLRVSTMVLCLISFSVMSADTVPGWTGDSFKRYDQYRYTLSANLIAFAYSSFQVIAEIHHMITKKRLIPISQGYVFNLAMDQIMSYLLISASSGATSQNYIWISRFGGDEFTKMINASVSMSFLAFFALALSSVISAYHLFRWIS